ncbi:MAG: hypothetical protein ABSA17_05240 [Rhabdochlamydiaceae bacterium]
MARWYDLSLGEDMPVRQVENPKKAKTTVYMTDEEETMLNELFIKRLRGKRKTDKSALLCEGIRLLFEKEIGDLPND